MYLCVQGNRLNKDIFPILLFSYITGFQSGGCYGVAGGRAALGSIENSKN